MSGQRFLGKLTKCAALALVFGVVGGTAFSGANYFMDSSLGKNQNSDTEQEAVIDSDKIKPVKTEANTVSTDISGVVEDVMPSIVSITNMTQQEIMSFFGQGGTIESESSGSGIIISKDEKYLYIATNNHVVERSDALTVQFSDDSTAPATIRGTDSADDLAVVQVKLSDLTDETLNVVKTAAIGDSEKISVGDPAIAIGNALGYGQSVTTGVISALGREVTFQDESTGETLMSRLIQTDAAINPGNSGGALVNAAGEVIGINSSKYADTEVEGMGFAIPMEIAGPILEDLVENGKVTKTGSPYLGIYGKDVTEEVSQQYHMPLGVYVVQVIDGSGAEEAGIMEGNIITKIGDKDITSMDDLKECLRDYHVGDSINVTVQIADNGTYLEKEVVVNLTTKME